MCSWFSPERKWLLLAYCVFMLKSLLLRIQCKAFWSVHLSGCSCGWAVCGEAHRNIAVKGTAALPSWLLLLRQQVQHPWWQDVLGPFQLEGTYGVGVRSLEEKDTKLGAVFFFFLRLCFLTFHLLLLNVAAFVYSRAWWSCAVTEEI